jgi:O-antigen/teichoic acid export membrane protein
MPVTTPPDDFPSFRRTTPDAVLALPAPVAGGGERQLRDRSLIRGVAWNGLVKLLVQAVAWGSTLVVARLLSPDDYGVVGMATFVLGLVELVTEFGIGITVAIRTDLTERQIQELNSVSVGFGLIGVAAICLVAPWVGRFFHDPRLTRVLICLSVTFFLSSLRSVPWGLLQRDLRFKRLAIYDGLQALALAGLSVVLALLGFGYWTLVIAAIASAAFTAALALVRHPVAFRQPNFQHLAGLLSFSGNIVGQRIAWYWYSNADFVVAGKMLGSGPLGSYTLAWNLSRVTDKVTSLVLQITPPVLAKVRDDHAELRRYVIRITEAMSLTVLPLMVGLALVAHDFVPLVLGTKWNGMIFPLQVLSAYAAVNVALPLFGQVLNVTGHEAFAMRHNFLQIAVMPCLFVIGAYFAGVNGIALAWVVGHPFLAARLARYSLRTIELRPVDYFRVAIAPSLVSCVLMTGAVVATRLSWPSTAPTPGRLFAEIAAGALAYLAALLLLYRHRLVDIRAFVQQMVRIKRGQAVEA